MYRIKGILAILILFMLCLGLGAQDGYRVPPTAIETTAQDLTNAWKDIGSEFDVSRYRYLALWVNIDINDSVNVRIRVLWKRALASTDEYPLPIKTIVSSVVRVEGNFIEFNVDVDQLMILGFDLKNSAKVIQVQVMAETVGASAGQIDSLYYSAGN